MRLLIVSILMMGVCAFAAPLPDEEGEVYYEARQTFGKQNWEVRLNAGWDYSNSFLSIYGFDLGAFYLIDPTMSVGLEGAIFTASKRGSATTLAEEMNKKFGYNTYAVSPSAKVVGVFRVTPISGMVNLFSERVIKVDISLLLRAGMIRYQVVGSGPNVGLGLETLLGLSENLGVTLAFHFDYERPTSVDWIHRSGVSIGPSFRF